MNPKGVRETSDDTRVESFLEGRTAIVTGGARGIGRAVVERLLAEGARIMFCARRAESVAAALERFDAPGKVAGRAADVRRAEDVEAVVAEAEERFGGVDVLVNNAGIGVYAPTADLTPDDWRRTIDTNLSGAFLFCRACLPRFRRRGGGRIVNVSSLAGRHPFAGGAAYNASKAGLNAFTEALLLDHRGEGITAAIVSPGSVDTEFSPRASGRDASWKIAPEDVAEAVAFILKMPPRTLVSTVELRPAKPPR